MADPNTTDDVKELPLDAKFKRLVKDKYILSTILKGCVNEFKGMDMEQTLACLELEEGNDLVKTRDTELFSEDGELVKANSVFDIKLPNDEMIGIIVNIEGRGRSNVEYPILNRAMYYAYELIVNQKGTFFKKQEYEKIRKVYSIWCMIRPPVPLRNTAIEYRLNGIL